MERSFRVLTTLTFILAFGIVQRVGAQISKRDDKLYKETAAEIRQAIWSMDLPHFKDYKVPAQYSNSGSVVLARHFDLSAGTLQSPRKNTKITLITRELVLLKDAASIKARSELSYTQFKKVTPFRGWDNKQSVFVGGRVIKPGGKVTELKDDDNVVTGENVEERAVKIAITDLEPGDMLDSYVAIEFEIIPVLLTSLPFSFPFYDREPVLHTTVHCTAGKKLAVEYRCVNGAPDFNCSMDAEGNNRLVIETDSIMHVPGGTAWTSPMRQFPVVQLNIVRGDLAPYTTFTRRKPGEVYKNQLAARIVKDATIDLNWAKREMLNYCAESVGKKSKAVATYFDTLARGGTLHEDTATAELYYMFRFDYMFGHLGNVPLESIINMGKKPLSSFFFSYLLSEYYKFHDMPSEVVLATSRYGPRMTEVLDKRDFYYICNVHQKYDRLLGMSGFYSPAFFVPAGLEGMSDAVAVDTKGISSYLANDYTQRDIQIPISGPEENQRLEDLTILPELEKGSLRVARMTSLNGHFKESIQRKLLLIEDFYNYEREAFGDERSLAERMSKEESSRNIAEELPIAFAQARKLQQEDFLAEAKEWLDAEVIDMNNAKVINPGVRHTAPAFEYASAFRLNGALKRGGSNYLLEVGKLIGQKESVVNSRLERNIDIYMPYANTVRTNMSVRVPERYEVAGLEELGKSVSNGAGHFTATASLEGSIVRITVETVFTSAHYPASNWPDLMAIMNAVEGWKNTKLLLRKKDDKS